MLEWPGSRGGMTGTVKAQSFPVLDLEKAKKASDWLELRGGNER